MLRKETEKKGFERKKGRAIQKERYGQETIGKCYKRKGKEIFC